METAFYYEIEGLQIVFRHQILRFIDNHIVIDGFKIVFDKVFLKVLR